MIKDITIGDIMIDCSDADRIREFYANLTGWERIVAYNCLALKAYNGLTILFVKTDMPYTPPVWPEEAGKQQKQIHFNFQVDDLPAAVEEASGSVRQKPLPNMAGSISLQCSIQRDIRFACVGGKLRNYGRAVSNCCSYT